MTGALLDPEVSHEITVTSFHASPFGGGIAIGKAGGGGLIRVVAAGDVLPRRPREGEPWRFTGRVVTHPDYGDQLVASVALPLVPKGEAIVRYLATNPAIKGIGWGYAQRLWDAFGERLYDLLAKRAAVALAEVIGIDLAAAVVEGFGLLAEETRVFQWLDRYGVAPRTAASAATVWGAGAIERIEADPYALTLMESWREVDERAQRLGLSLTDERRLAAVVEEACARRWRACHTASAMEKLRAHVRHILGPRTAHVAGDALRRAIETGILVDAGNGLWQSRAAWLMERTVEKALSRRIHRESSPLNPSVLASAIARVEHAEGLTLTLRQREAVHMAVTSPVSIVAGGAGTGKTTVIRAVLEAGKAKGDSGAFPQIALAGRAAKRIAEATGAPAMTVYRFLKALENRKLKLSGGLLIVDESSMIDLPNLYRIMRVLPDSVDIVLVGDPAQLPPIGPGLVFHRLVGNDAVPQVMLDIVHRQANATGIPRAGAAIRAGQWPDIPEFDPANPFAKGVFLARCGSLDLPEKTLAVWEAMVGKPSSSGDLNALRRLHQAKVQILAPTRHGPAGAKTLSDEIERRWLAHAPRLGDLGLSVGSKILWIKNDYDRPSGRKNADGEEVTVTLMNGTLGVVQRPTEKGAWVLFDDGEADEIREHDLTKLERGWAISVHKAQGSAWKRVIVPVARSRLLDRALIYTAITRAQATVVLVGDEGLIAGAVQKPPHAFQRDIALTMRPPDHCHLRTDIPSDEEVDE